MDEASFFERVASYKFLTKKEVGQNFLIDPYVAKRIVNALDIQEGERVLEIGCGAGSLTYFLAEHSNPITVIDIDEAMLLKVKEDFASVHNLQVEYGNAAKYEYAPFEKIIGNLPYYITSLIIEKALLGGTSVKKMVFMVQKEAAERLLAKPKTKDYSPLSILISLCYDAKRLFNVGRNAFVPPPHVDSSVFELVRKDGISLEEGAKAFALATELFKFRRKTIYNNLKNLLHDGDKACTILAKRSILENARPEELTPEQYRLLAIAI